VVSHKLSKDQQAALEVISENSWPILVTGGAGTGKSELLREFVRRQRALGSVAVAAPTGIAALNVGGLTLHSLFGLGITGIMNPNSFRKTNSDYFKDLRVLVIDEVSMVRVDVMNTVDNALRFHLGRDEPFGGLKLVMFGDPYQLPPVISGNDWWQDNRTSEKVLRTFPFFFNAGAFENRKPRILSLTTLHRQADQIKFTEVLNRVRESVHSHEDLDYLVKNSNQSEPEIGTLRIFGRNDAVEVWNSTRLSALGEAPQRTYSAEWETNQALIENFKKFYRRNFGTEFQKLLEMYRDYESRVREAQNQAHNDLNPWEKTIVLKIGARVIFTKNDTNNRWVNGSTGTVLSVDDHSVSVRLDESNLVVNVTSVKFEKSAIVWTVGKDDRIRLSVEVVGWFKQIPLRLGWAITVHKSQGQTLDAAVLDFTDQYFEKGQAYVALSRVRTLDKLFFQSVPKMLDILSVDTRVQRFMKAAETEPFDNWVNPEDRSKKLSESVFTIAEDFGYSKPEFMQLLEMFLEKSTVFTSLDHLLTFVAESDNPRNRVRIIVESFEK
jgi:ATP-dependent exoDNAse (exonuclease V) alpha subunit